MNSEYNSHKAIRTVLFEKKPFKVKIIRDDDRIYYARNCVSYDELYRFCKTSFNWINVEDVFSGKRIPSDFYIVTFNINMYNGELFIQSERLETKKICIKVKS